MVCEDPPVEERLCELHQPAEDQHCGICARPGHLWCREVELPDALLESMPAEFLEPLAMVLLG